MFVELADSEPDNGVYEDDEEEGEEVAPDEFVEEEEGDSMVDRIFKSSLTLSFAVWLLLFEFKPILLGLSDLT